MGKNVSHVVGSMVNGGCWKSGAHQRHGNLSALRVFFVKEEANRITKRGKQENYICIYYTVVLIHI